MAAGIPGKSVRANLYGVRVDRAAATIPQSTSSNLFTITGGRILLMTILGEVTTAIQAQATTMKLTHTQGATTTDLCATVDMTGQPVGALYGITGAVGTAAVAGSGVPQNNELILQAGTIKALTVASSTGAMKWTMFWIPLDDGVTVASA